MSPYAVSKLAGKHYARVFQELYGLQTVSLRYSNVFGPRQDPSSEYSGVISRFIFMLLQGGQPVIYGDCEQTRDFVYVADVVKLQTPDDTFLSRLSQACILNLFLKLVEDELNEST